MIKNEKKGFTLIEVTVVVAIMVVLLAVLSPYLMKYVESSRMQRDESAMDEVCNAVQLALADTKTFDEVCSYAIPNNYLTYTDSSGVYGAKNTDEEFWAPDGYGEAMTITFNPDKNGVYDLSKGVVNDMTLGNGSVAESRAAEEQKRFLADSNLYTAITRSIGTKIAEKSTTYKHSSYTVFIKPEMVGGMQRFDIYGSFNGTNLTEASPASLGSGTESYTPDKEPITTLSGGTTKPNITESDLLGGGTITLRTYHDFTIGWTNKYKAGYTDETTDFEIPETFYDEEADKWYKVVAIGQAAFSSCGNLTSVSIPKSVTTIGDSAFHSCSNLISASIPEGVTSMGVGVFYNCESLTSITIPDSITAMGNSAFAGCSSLTSATLSEGITAIGDSTFSECSSLTSITIPEGVTAIGDSAFRDCSSLAEITIPNDVKTIGNNAFYDCESLTAITIPEGATSIGNSAFYSCSNLTSVSIPNSVTSIEDAAFMSCSKLNTITIPEGITTIGDSTFRDCRTLTSVTIPSSVTYIESMAFLSCRKLTDINYNGTMEQWNAITKGGSDYSAWDYKTGDYTIHCTDGNIAK